MLCPEDYDWFHMAADHKNPGRCKGYAFINCTSAARVASVFQKLDGRKWGISSKKRCRVSYARVQAGTPEYEFVLKAARREQQQSGASPKMHRRREHQQGEIPSLKKAARVGKGKQVTKQ